MPYIPPGMVSRVKSALVSDTVIPRVIPFGLFAGLRMDISFRSRTQPYLGLWEREIAGWTRRLATGAHTAMDIGCRDCFYSMYLAKHTDAKVFAFDPDPKVEVEIRRCMVLNQADANRVQYFKKAVGIDFPLDSLLPLPEPIFVKMDVDGGEVEVLRTSPKLLARNCRWVIETHSPALERQCIDILRGYGLWTQVIDHAWWRVIVPEQRAKNCRWLAAFRPNDSIVPLGNRAGNSDLA